jgi:hypothetical protein
MGLGRKPLRIGHAHRDHQPSTLGVNRPSYIQPYEVGRREPERRIGGHKLHKRDPRECDFARFGRERVEQQHRGEGREDLLR